ncbi:PBECR2 nuclease fold domain-containing protein, partial [Campylobacter cuniculorum]
MINDIVKSEKIQNAEALRGIQQTAKPINDNPSPELAKDTLANQSLKHNETLENAGVKDLKTTSLSYNEAIDKLNHIQPQEIPPKINIDTFLKTFNHFKNKQNFINHFSKKADKEQRLAYLNLIEPTFKQPDLMFKKDNRQTFIKAFKDENNTFFYLVITQDNNEKLITAFKTNRKAFIEKKLKNADPILTFDGRNSKNEKSLQGLQEHYNTKIQEKQEQVLNPLKHNETLENEPFGVNFSAFYHKGKEAINHLLKEKQGQVKGAFYREDLGDISLVWGEAGTGKSDGFGLAKIAKYHPEVLEDLTQLIENLPLKKQTQNRITLEDEHYKAVIRNDFDAKKEKWVLTAFEKKESIIKRRTDPLNTSNNAFERTTSKDTLEDFTIKLNKKQIQEKKEEVIKLLNKAGYTKESFEKVYFDTFKSLKNDPDFVKRASGIIEADIIQSISENYKPKALQYTYDYLNKFYDIMDDLSEKLTGERHHYDFSYKASFMDKPESFAKHINNFLDSQERLYAESGDLALKEPQQQKAFKEYVNNARAFLKDVLNDEAWHQAVKEDEALSEFIDQSKILGSAEREYLQSLMPNFDHRAFYNSLFEQSKHGTQEQANKTQEASINTKQESLNAKTQEGLKQDVQESPQETQNEMLYLNTDSPKGIKALREDLKAHLQPLLNKEIINKETNMHGVITQREMNKISSNKAVEKSLKNGFSTDEHFKASAEIKNLF